MSATNTTSTPADTTSSSSTSTTTSDTSTTSTPLSTTSTPSTTTPASTSTFTAPTTAPPTTQIITSTVSVPPSNGNTAPASTVVITQVSTPSPSSGNSATLTSSSASSTSSGASNGNKGSSNGGGLSPAGTIAIAVVIPVVVVAILVFLGLFWWRRRKQRKLNEDERRKEMEAYGFNPNNDPTLPAVGGVAGSEDDQSGYRGWGAGTSSNRKASTTLSSGVGQPASYAPGSPNGNTDTSGDTLVAGAIAGAGAGAGGAAAANASNHSRNTTMDSDTMGAYGNGNMHSARGVQRGPSNASSTYSMGDRSRHSEDAPIPVTGNEQYYTDYYQNGPYDNPYAQGQEAVIKDNPARRNTRIERAPTFPNQGSSGIAQNF